MKKILLFLAFILSLVVVYNIRPSPIDRVKLAYDLDKVSVAIETVSSYGSGVLIKRGDYHYVWTDDHVVNGVNNHSPVSVSKKYLDADGKEIGTVEFTADTIAYSLSLDLAILRIRQKHAFGNASAKFYTSDTPLKVGTELVHVGHFAWMQGWEDNGTGATSFTTGTLAQVNRFRGLRRFDFVTTIGVAGCSGGGVFTADGECIGLVDIGYSPTNVLITPVRDMRQWVKRINLDWLIDNKSPPKDSEVDKLVMKTEPLKTPEK